MHLKIKGGEKAKSPRNLFEDIILYSFSKVRVNGEHLSGCHESKILSASKRVGLTKVSKKRTNKVLPC
ncbi:MAG: hypothetical protein EBT92_13180 [Planctomycetes bacterium]|nr:hypothetical protein [Planctomycetota bacterium]NBY01391.1 hypothetical protein [Planctomycetota bacterium]